MTDIYEGFLTRIKNNGIASSNRFYVRINVNALGSGSASMFPLQRLRDLSVMCNSVSLPKRSIKTLDFVVKPGNVDKIADYQEYDHDLSMTFYCSPDLNERRFFENWANMVIDPVTKQPNYYDEYAKNNVVTVFVLPKMFSGGLVDERTVDYKGNPLYYVRFHECYPTSIDENELSTESSELLQLKVTLSYKYFTTISDESSSI